LGQRTSCRLVSPRRLSIVGTNSSNSYRSRYIRQTRIAHLKFLGRTMSRLFKRGRTPSDASSHQQRNMPFSNDELQQDDPEAQESRPVSASYRARARSITSASALPSSYKTPSRSYIHHAAHGFQGNIQSTSMPAPSLS
jgi:hypothetical protein